MALMIPDNVEYFDFLTAALHASKKKGDARLSISLSY